MTTPRNRIRNSRAYHFIHPSRAAQHIHNTAVVQVSTVPHPYPTPPHRSASSPRAMSPFSSRAHSSLEPPSSEPLPLAPVYAPLFSTLLIAPHLELSPDYCPSRDFFCQTCTRTHPCPTRLIKKIKETSSYSPFSCAPKLSRDTASCQPLSSVDNFCLEHTPHFHPAASASTYKPLAPKSGTTFLSQSIQASDQANSAHTQPRNPHPADVVTLAAMKLTHLILAILAAIFLCTPSVAVINPRRQERLLRIANKTALVQNNQQLFEQAFGIIRRLLDGCDPNVCFALDGSGSLGPDNYEIQRQFVLLLAAIIGANPRASFAAVQYGLVNVPISNLDRNAPRFIQKLLSSQYQGAPTTFVGAGLAACISQLLRRRGEPAKLVIFGDGGANIGAETGPLSPPSLADFFRRRSPANRICAVAVDFPRKPPLFVDIVGGRANRSLVTDVEGWPLILNQLRDLIRTICERAPEF